MGIHEDMNWLKSNEKGWGRAFRLIAGEGGIGIRRLKELYGGEDWWPVKAYARLLVDRGLVVEEEGVFSLTEQGKKVFDMMKTMEGVAQV
jgi:ribosomal protein S19E (S16A)